MTAEERAEKIADAIGINPNWGRQESIRYYTAEIRQAFDDGVQKGKEDHQTMLKPNMDALQRIVEKKAKSEAYEEAAKIADQGDRDSAECCWVADKIRALKEKT